MDILDHDLLNTQPQLKKLRRRIMIARVFLFVLLAIGTLITVTHLKDPYAAKNMLTTVLILSACIISYFKPFISFTITSLVILCAVPFSLYHLISSWHDLTFDPDMLLESVLDCALSMVVTFFFVRGALSARKHERLQELVRQKNGAT